MLAWPCRPDLSATSGAEPTLCVYAHRMSTLALLCLAVGVIACAPPVAPAINPPKAVVIVSANMEWSIVKQIYRDAHYEQTPWGETFVRDVARAAGGSDRIVFLHGGWGKVAAAGSAQYAIDRWHPQYVI